LIQFQRGFLVLLLGMVCVLVAVQPVQGQEAHHPDEAHPVEANKAPSPPTAAQERSSVTHHDLVLNDATLHYTATAGTLLIREGEDEHPYGSMFYVAYTLDGAEPNTRPVTFLYNGGPGSSSIWLLMGSVGPVRVVTASPQATGPAPYQVVANQDCLLDKTDLVFIDAPLTGFSRAVGTATARDFAGVDQDLKAFDKFVLRWVTANQRWNSPKYLFGESYGTTRSAGLADALQNDGLSLNGVILLSSILNYNAMAAGLDVQFVGYLPSYAAIAWYYNKLQNKPADVKPFLNEVRAFARGEYAEALAEGDQIAPQHLNAVAVKMASYTGLSVQYVKEAKLRVSPARFRKELLRNEGDILGRYDARFEGTDVDNAGEYPGYDPSDTGIESAFVAAFQDYAERELKYQTTDAYRPLTKIINEWDWHHQPPNGEREEMPDVALDLADAMRKNPRLRVFSANGLFDLATPFFLTEFDLSHMMLAPQLQKNVSFGYYPSGHMAYLNVQALTLLVHDLDGFYTATQR
jgi:carboxypeptidase C (cathepsin A)